MHTVDGPHCGLTAAQSRVNLTARALAIAAIISPPRALRESVPAVEPIRAERAPGRNLPCPCGSGRKHKRCCLSPDRRN